VVGEFVQCVEDHIEVWSQQAPGSGYAIKLVFRDGPTLTIPIENDQLAVDKVTLPTGYRIAEGAP
jgi:hypothetical protein